MERPPNNLIGLGKNSGQVNGTAGLVLAAVTPTADATMVTDTAISDGTADSTVTTTAGGLEALKNAVDAQQVAAGAMYNQISNTMEHLTNLSATLLSRHGFKIGRRLCGRND